MANDERPTARSASVVRASPRSLRLLKGGSVPSRPHSASGFTLTEVIISILLTGIIVTGTFSAVLVAKKTPQISTNRVSAALAERQLLETLQNYQTASYQGSDAGSGPGGSWHLPGDRCTLCTVPNCGCAAADCGAGCYALQTGCTHDVSDLLPQFMKDSPYFAKMCYTVSNLDGSGAQENFRPQVTVNIQWNEVQE